MPPNDPGAYSPEELALLAAGPDPGDVPIGPEGIPTEGEALVAPETMDDPALVPQDAGAPSLDPAQAAQVMMAALAQQMQMDLMQFQQAQEQALMIAPEIVAQMVEGLATPPETMDDAAVVPPEGVSPAETGYEGEGPEEDLPPASPEEIAALG